MIRYPCIKRYTLVRGITAPHKISGYVVMLNEETTSGRENTYNRAKLIYKRCLENVYGVDSMAIACFHKKADGLFYRNGSSGDAVIRLL